MHIYSLLTSGLILVPLTTSALTYEPNVTLERDVFGELTTSTQAVSTDDPVDDLIVFDRQNRATPPPLLADITKMSVSPDAEGWTIAFEIEEALPEDPGMPVNFHIFVDRDSRTENNAPNGVFRARSDLVFMILFGERTKWYTTWWTFDPTSGRWQEQTQEIAFTHEGTDFSLTIPYSVLPQSAEVSVRGLSLTSKEGITAIDVVPGKGLPAISAEQPQPIPPPKQPPVDGPDQEVINQPSFLEGKDFSNYVIPVITFILGISLVMWWKKR